MHIQSPTMCLHHVTYWRQPGAQPQSENLPLDVWLGHGLDSCCVVSVRGESGPALFQANSDGPVTKDPQADLSLHCKLQAQTTSRLTGRIFTQRTKDYAGWTHHSEICSMIFFFYHALLQQVAVYDGDAFVEDSRWGWDCLDGCSTCCSTSLWCCARELSLVQVTRCRMRSFSHHGGGPPPGGAPPGDARDTATHAAALGSSAAGSSLHFAV